MLTIRCKIADLVTVIPTDGDMASRCKEYLYYGSKEADIIISADDYKQSKYFEKIPYSTVAYMGSAYQFYLQLLKYEGFYLHASAVELDGRAYLFSGNSGIGKSTHTRLWQQCFGTAARVFNDDKPALRYIDGVWYAYGTPWCGKDGINENKKVPLQGICFLKQGQDNSIRRLNYKEAVTKLISQTLRRTLSKENMNLLLGHIDKLVREIPVYELENRPDREAVYLSYNTMHRDMEDI